jgi:hypothetical protein
MAVRRASWRFAALLGVLAATCAGALVAAGHDGTRAARDLRHRPSAALSTLQRHHRVSPSTTSTTAPTTTTIPATQTSELPSAATGRFQAEMLALFQAIRLGTASIATSAFFPEAAYVRLKAIADPASDYESRLMAEYRLDIAAAHAYLGVGARQAEFVGVTVPVQEAAWIPPGACANRIGYWHDPGARLLYREGGTLRSIGIASLISWHGVWYVVHLGGVLRPSTTGLVDAPALGPGDAGPPGGC